MGPATARLIGAMTEAYVGLGGNVGQPARHVAVAAHRLANWPGVSDLRCSRLFQTAPWGDLAQPDFVNAVVAFTYAGDAGSLLAALLTIEREAGRVRDLRRWGPRTLDLDLLLFGDQVIETPTLVVPHPRLRDRGFVLLPLHDVAPGLHLPDGESVAALAAGVDRAGISVVSDAVESARPG